MKPECVWCPEKKFGSWLALAKHLCADHSGRKHQLDVPGNAYLYPVMGVISCWCRVGQGIGIQCDTFEDFARHLKERGGLQAHLAEIALGAFP